MTWEEKFEAIQSFHSSCCLQMRRPGNWYVSMSGMEIVSGGCLIGEHGNGTTPESAVNDHWAKFTEPPKVFKVANKYFIWAGYMFREVSLEEVKAREP